MLLAKATTKKAYLDFEQAVKSFAPILTDFIIDLASGKEVDYDAISAKSKELVAVD